MKISDVYFENIFLPIKALWKGQYELAYGNEAMSFVKSLGEDFEEVEFLVDVKSKREYNEWHSMMVLVIYQVLTKTGLRLLGQGIYSLNIDSIPVQDFEEKYLENLQSEGNEMYLSKYKGRMD
jgi:hypothetical protein